MKVSIQLRLGQHLTMTPQLQQAIKLLQLSTLELQKEIQEALDTNLMLEEGDEAERFLAAEADDMRLAPQPEPEPSYAQQEALAEREVPAESSEMPDELPVDTQWDDVFDSYGSGGSGSGDEEFDPLTQQSRPLTLYDHLWWQLQLSHLSERDLMIAQVIIDAIDADGYLRCEIAELVATLGDPSIGADEVQTLLYRVQALDPAGVGARHLQECLLIQLRQLPPETPHCQLALTICRKGFEALPRKDIPALLKLCGGAAESEIHAALALIRSLQPRPGTLIASPAPEYIVPDIFVRKIEGRWRVELNSEIAPKLRVNAEYLNLIRRSDQSPSGALLKNHLQEARWLIKSLASRNETVLRVGAKIVEMQQDFFERGDEGMRPLILRDIAAELDLHESTVSRVTTQKYMNTPRGTFEFKYFFSSHVTTASGGECSSTAIRALIRKLIAAESTKKPLSDDKIAKDLADQGIQVARRTVAKYREAMGIPPSNERKRLN